MKLAINEMNMKKKIFTLLLSIAGMGTMLAGGLLTNTNQHISFNRMMARGASTEIDGVYTNPAGTAWLDHEGFTLSANIQSAFQTRDVTATFPLFTEENHTKKYEGDAAAPIIPSLYAAYKKDRWAVSAFLGITGGGGKCSFDSGLPMFDAAVMTKVYATSASMLEQFPAAQAVLGGPITPDQYSINTAMKGRQYIYGAQIGGAYQINNHFSGYVGLRMNYFDGNYSGHVQVSANPELATKLGTLAGATAVAAPALSKQLSAMAAPNGIADIALDCDQTGWGVTPIIGVNYRWNGLTLAAKYEFKTNLNIENDTKELRPTGEAALADFEHGVNTPNDLPSIFYFAVGYEFTPKLRATLEYHFFDDKNADMAKVVNPENPSEKIGKEQLLKRGTNELLAGVEYDINKMFTVSAGFQRTDYGLSDGYQTHTAFSCDSYSIGFGGAVNLTEKLRLNAGYFWTTYSDYTKESAAGNPGYCGTTLAGKDVYSRTNKVLGIGIDYKF